jgi:hypothetical protein
MLPRKSASLALVLAILSLPQGAEAAPKVVPITVTPSWSTVISANNTTIPTLQVVVNPLLEKELAGGHVNTIHDAVFSNLAALGADYVRFSTWYPYPHLDVAELYQPKAGKTHWDFDGLDPIVDDFLGAMGGRTSIFNFSTIPEWMYLGGTSVSVPTAENSLDWGYEQGTTLRDRTLKEVSGYFARVAAWYNLGGFTDEYGEAHASGHFYGMPYWEVLNEIQFEHGMTAPEYTAIYDAVVAAIKEELPSMKFVAPAMAWHGLNAKYMKYFLSHAKEQVDMLSYHFYGFPSQGSVFNQADVFLKIAASIETMKHEVSPNTKTTVDELGTIDEGINIPFTSSYWNLSGAMYAYTFTHLALLGVDVVGESQLVGFPSQYPSVSMVNWTTGAPNARYWALKLLIDEMGSSRNWIQTVSSSKNIFAQAFVDSSGNQRILLVNKSPKATATEIAGVQSGNTMRFVSQAAAGIQTETLTSPSVSLPGYGVAVIEL